MSLFAIRPEIPASVSTTKNITLLSNCNIACSLIDGIRSDTIVFCSSLADLRFLTVLATSFSSSLMKSFNASVLRFSLLAAFTSGAIPKLTAWLSNL